MVNSSVRLFNRGPRIYHDLASQPPPCHQTIQIPCSRVFRGRCGPTVDAYSDASMSDHLIHGVRTSKDPHSDLVVYASIFEGPLR